MHRPTGGRGGLQSRKVKRRNSIAVLLLLRFCLGVAPLVFDTSMIVVHRRSLHLSFLLRSLCLVFVSPSAFPVCLPFCGSLCLSFCGPFVLSLSSLLRFLVVSPFVFPCVFLSVFPSSCLCLPCCVSCLFCLSVLRFVVPSVFPVSCLCLPFWAPGFKARRAHWQGVRIGRRAFFLRSNENCHLGEGEGGGGNDRPIPRYTDCKGCPLKT